MFCQFCGAPLPSNSRFCQHCGSRAMGVETDDVKYRPVVGRMSSEKYANGESAPEEDDEEKDFTFGDEYSEDERVRRAREAEYEREERLFLGEEEEDFDDPDDSPIPRFSYERERLGLEPCQISTPRPKPFSVEEINKKYLIYNCVFAVLCCSPFGLLGALFSYIAMFMNDVGRPDGMAGFFWASAIMFWGGIIAFLFYFVPLSQAFMDFVDRL